MTKQRVDILLALFFFSTFWVACKRVAEPCLQTVNVSANIGIYQPSDTGALGIDSVLPKAVLGYAENGIIQYSGVKSNKFIMRLSLQKDTCRWFISPDSSLLHMDTITMIYSRQLVFLSTACGYAYHYYINDVKWTLNSIDSIKIKNSNVDGTANIEHVKVFY